MTSFGVGMGWGWGERTKREPRISRYDHGNPPWSHGKHFSRMLRKRYKNKAKRRVPDPTNPFGNPCGFGLALLYFGRRFWRYSQSPHGARTGAAEHEAGAKRRPKIWSAKRDFLAKSEKTVSGVTWVRSSFLPKVAATRVPHQNESFVELIGDQRFRI